MEMINHRRKGESSTRLVVACASTLCSCDKKHGRNSSDISSMYILFLCIFLSL